MADHPITAVVVGAGNRGLKYASYAELRPDRLKIVGVAEPSASRRRAAGKRFGVPPACQFSSAEELAAQPKMADAAINGTMDRFSTCQPRFRCWKPATTSSWKSPSPSTRTRCGGYLPRAGAAIDGSWSAMCFATLPSTERSRRRWPKASSET